MKKPLSIIVTLAVLINVFYFSLWTYVFSAYPNHHQRTEAFNEAVMHIPNLFFPIINLLSLAAFIWLLQFNKGRGWFVSGLVLQTILLSLHLWGMM